MTAMHPHPKGPAMASSRREDIDLGGHESHCRPLTGSHVIKLLLWKEPSGFCVDDGMEGVRLEKRKGQTKPMAVGHCCCYYYYLLKWWPWAKG